MHLFNLIIFPLQIKQLYELITDMQMNKPDEETAMFSKKYVGPANCASCDKNITNLIGTPADHLVWKRLPFREPSERIARVSNFHLKSNVMVH